MDNKKVITKLIEASQKISNDNKSSANYVIVSELIISGICEELSISRDEAIELMESQLK